MTTEENNQQELEQQEIKALWERAPSVLKECREILSELRNDRNN